MKVTADTITDDQIRCQMEESWSVYANACRALGFSPLNGSKYSDENDMRAHRAECATILNAKENRK